jgi:hypothetical protein
MGLEEDLRGGKAFYYMVVFPFVGFFWLLFSEWILLLCFFPLVFSTLFFFFIPLYVFFLFRLIIYANYGVKERKGQQSLDVFE